MATTYPGPAPKVNGDSVTIHRFMNNPTLIARRLRSLLQQRYISDAILKGRFQAEGGAIMFESGDPMFVGEDARAISAGGEYPLVTLGNGALSTAKVTKWGQDSLVTDEAIKRLQRNPVDRALTKLANQNVKTVDSVTMSVVTSAITASKPASSAWATATADQILGDVMGGKVAVTGLEEGYDPDTVVLSDQAWVAAFMAFSKAGWFPRETAASNPIFTGEFPVLGGMVWLRTSHGVSNTALVLDSEQLGGMADEDLGGPGYVSASGEGTAPVEVKSIREDKEDRYRVRARRVTVPVVLEPGAGFKVTGVTV